MSSWGHFTLEQKVGQLFMCGFHGQHVDEQITRLIQDYHVGVLFTSGATWKVWNN